MSKSTNGLRKVGLASLAVTLTLGAGLAGAGAANAVQDFTFDRIGGTDRFETAKMVATNFDGLQSFDEVILVNGQRGQYADALAAAHLAGDRQIPILLTKTDETPDFTLEALKANDVKKITIVGGEGVVSKAQEDELAKGYSVSRISGIDRYATNARVLEAAGTATSDTAIVAAGNNFADALAGSPAAYMGSPLGLAKVDDLDDDVKKAIVDSGVKKAIILGGPTVVGPEVEAELKTAGLAVERVYGADRSETSMELADYGIANLGYTNKGANVASGSTELYGADALSGGPLTGEQKRPMLITMNVDKPGQLEEWFEANANTLEEGVIFGQNGAVSTRVQQLLETAASSTTTNQEYTVSGGSAYANTGDVKQYTVTGISASKVDIVLASTDDVNVNSANGQVTFNGTNPGGTGNTAKFTATDATITVLNGTTTGTGGNTAYDTAVNNGTVTFTVQVGADDFVPVVFADNGDNILSLNADSTPSEDFGVGTETTVVPAEAGDTTAPTGKVTTVDKASDLFVTDAGTAGSTYYYDSNDQFQVKSGSATTYTTVTMAQFEAALSVDDTLGGLIYRSNPADQSTFQLDDVAPTSPAFSASPADDGKGGVKVAVTAAPSAGDPASYNVYRATATQPTITGAPVTCPSVTGTSYSKVGSIAADATSLVYYDRTAQPPATGTGGTTGVEANPQYCYYVTTVDEGGQESTPAQGDVKRTEAVAATTTPTAAAPAFKSGSVSGPNTLSAVYTEDVDAGTVNGGDFRVTYTPAGSSTSYNIPVASATESATAGTVTINLTWPTELAAPAANDVYIVTAQKSTTDGNTVGDVATSTTPQQFQAVGDQLYIQQ